MSLTRSLSIAEGVSFRNWRRHHREVKFPHRRGSRRTRRFDPRAPMRCRIGSGGRYLFMFLLGFFDDLVLLGPIFGKDADQVCRNGCPKLEGL